MVVSMDIVLRTNKTSPKLEIRDIERFGDGSGFKAYLIVISGGFCAEHRFYFEADSLASFTDALEGMDQTLKGSAKLKPLYEEDYIELEMSTGGHVIVRGELFEYAPESQHLKFEFVTDQTCLSPLVSDLKKCANLDAT